MTLRIEDYALIGDCKTAALVGRDGSIDWLCWPRFDSAACFAALLGDADNGRWLLAPKDPLLSIERRYRPGTLVLETEFQTETGSAAVIDFMVPADGANLVRTVTGRSGRVVFQTELVVRFNYGAHLGDGGRPSWRPLVGVVLPPLWHQGHKGNAPDCRGGNYPRTAAEVAAPSGGLGWSVPARWRRACGGAVIPVAVLVLTAPAISWWAAPSGAAERCLVDGEVAAAHRQHYIEPRPQRIVRGGEHPHFVDRC